MASVTSRWALALNRMQICSSRIEAPTSRVGRLPCSPTTARFWDRSPLTRREGNLQSPWGLAYIRQGVRRVRRRPLGRQFQQRANRRLQGHRSQSEASGQFQGELLNTRRHAAHNPRAPVYPFRPRPGDSRRNTHVGLLFTAETDSLHNSGINWNISLYGEITPNVPLRMATATGGSANPAMTAAARATCSSAMARESCRWKPPATI